MGKSQIRFLTQSLFRIAGYVIQPSTPDFLMLVMVEEKLNLNFILKIIFSCIVFL